MKFVIWIGSSKKDLLAFPYKVIRVMGYVLYCAQTGKLHEKSKVLKGFGVFNSTFNIYIVNHVYGFWFRSS